MSTKTEKPATEKPVTGDAKNDTAPAPEDTARAERRAAFKALKFQGATCPKHPKHEAKVYRTDGKTRYCKCDDCGETWKRRGSFADPLKQVCEDLVKILDDSEDVSVEPGQPRVILFDAKEARALADQLRGLLLL
jgi:hypothetical protein